MLCLNQELWSTFHLPSFTCTGWYIFSYFFCHMLQNYFYKKLFDTIRWSFVCCLFFLKKIQFSSCVVKLCQIDSNCAQKQISLFKRQNFHDQANFLYHRVYNKPFVVRFISSSYLRERGSSYSFVFSTAIYVLIHVICTFSLA